MNVLDIFYNEIIDEAKNGRVDCYFMYNTIFNTQIPSLGIDLISDSNNNNLLIPTLKIDDVETFNNLLIEYAKKSYEFYLDELMDMFSFNEIDQNEKEKLKYKTLMTLLWSNATIEDFNNPINFLKKRISFIDDKRLLDYDNFSFFSESMNSEIEVNVSKSKLVNETPYSLSIKLKDINSLESYYLPNVYLGINDNEAYIYAIQNDKTKENEGSFSKKINRFLYKVNGGLDVKEDTFENYDLGNLKDVSSSFVLTANIIMGIINDLGIKNVVIPSILITRWNAKEITNDIKKNFKNYNYEENEEKHEQIQANLTEKFLRTFRRLDHHHSGINISSYPSEIDSSMHITIDDNNTCNNEILNDTYLSVVKKNISK